MPRFCRDGKIDSEAARELKTAFDAAWDQSRARAGVFDDLTDARDQAHAVAVLAMDEVCPAFQTPATRIGVKNFRRQGPKGWGVVYDTLYNWAFTRLTS